MEDRFLQSQQVKDEYYQSNIVKELEKEQIRHEAERHKWVLGVIILCVVFVSSSIIYNVYSRKKHMQAEHQKEIKHQNEIIRQKTLTLTVIQKHLLEKLEHVSQIISDTERIKMTEEAWKELEYLLDDTDNHFVQNLRQQYKDFKEEDIQLCMLIRLRMDNAVVSNIYHISVSAVKKRKLNLKKNGFHVTDPAIHLEEVIERL